MQKLWYRLYTPFFTPSSAVNPIFFFYTDRKKFRNRNWPPIFVGIWNSVFNKGILTGMFFGFQFVFWVCSRSQLQIQYVTAICGFQAVPTKSIYSSYKYKYNFHDLIQSILSNVIKCTYMCENVLHYLEYILFRSSSLKF